MAALIQGFGLRMPHSLTEETSQPELSLQLITALYLISTQQDGEVITHHQQTHQLLVQHSWQSQLDVSTQCGGGRCNKEAAESTSAPKNKQKKQKPTLK